jgi:hypothetical protein
MSPFLAQTLTDPLKRAAMSTQVTEVQPTYQELLNRLGSMHPVLGTSQNIPSGLRIVDITDSEGNILLFRTITSEGYKKDFLNDRSAQEFDRYSYSANPRISEIWSRSFNSTLLIAIQNIKTDALFFPNANKLLLNNPLAYSPVTADTLLNDIIFYEEIKVPRRMENVILSIPSWIAEVYLRTYWHAGLNQKEIVQGMLAMPRVLPSVKDAEWNLAHITKGCGSVLIE